MNKPDFLPFRKIPLDKEHARQAGEYVLQLTGELGRDLRRVELEELLTGESNLIRTTRQRQIIRMTALSLVDYER